MSKMRIQITEGWGKRNQEEVGNGTYFFKDFVVKSSIIVVVMSLDQII